MIGQRVLEALQLGGRWIENPNAVLALELAAQGWHVSPFSVFDGKKMPAIKGAHPEGDPLHGKCTGGCGRYGHGTNDATIEADAIDHWFCRQYPDAVVNVNCAKSGIVCLDFDRHPGKPDGVKSFQAYARGENIKFNTPLQKTPGGGYHAIFKAPILPEGVRLPGRLPDGKKWVEGVDIKFNGGFCTGFLPDGRSYEWLEHREFFNELQPFPAWILRRIIDAERVRASEYTPSKPVTGTRPGDDYRNRHTWAEVLAECLPGWFIDGEKVYRSEKNKGVKATLRDDVFYIFTEAGLPGNVKSRTGYNKFSLLVDTVYGGRYSEAAKELRQKGYGTE